MHTPRNHRQRRELETAELGQTNQSDRDTPHPREVPFVFTGTGSEYFRIWIVNLLLTILTLGIYSAWAKVRNKQYFYGNTSLEGTSFSYHAEPVKILVGRLIAAVFFVAYILAEQLSLVASLAMLGIFMVVMPWLICSSLRFNARYSRYRNLAFDFRGRPWGAFQAFVLWPMAGALTFGLLFPLAYQRQQRFVVGNHAYGRPQFQFSAGPGSYYQIFLALLGAFLVAGLSVGILSILLGFLVGQQTLATLIGGLFVLVYLLLFAGFTAATSRLMYNSSSLEGHQFVARWSVFSYARLVLVNTLVTIVTLGLFMPWAKVRLAHYKAEHTSVLVAASLDEFVEDQRQRESSVAEGVTDLFDFDVGL